MSIRITRGACTFALAACLLASGCWFEWADPEASAQPAPTPDDATSKKVDQQEQKKEQPMRAASQLSIAKIDEGAAWYAPSVDVLESMPLQFVVKLTKDLPTPGDKIELEKLDGPDAAGKIVAKVLHTPSPDPAATVMTPTPLRFPLGSLKPGQYALEIHIRSADQTAHVLEQTISLTAK